MVKRHFVVLKADSGSPTVHPMKEWLRQNPHVLPHGPDPGDSTSHELRRALRRAGWELEELLDRVLLIRPDENGDTSFADELLASAEDIREITEEDELAEAEKITFGLERDLQAALRNNIEQLEPGLRIIDGGTERVTEAGRVDITALDNDGNIVVIELKAGSAPPAIITQVLAYMASVAESDGKPVRGILVAGDFHGRVVLAARAIPNLDLRQYGFQFTFRPIT